MKRLRLLPNAGAILRKAWSVRLAILAVVSGSLEAALPILSNAVPSGVFLSLSVLASTVAVIARVVAQPELHDSKEPK